MLILSFDIATDKMYLHIEKDGETIANKHYMSTKEKYNSAVLIPYIRDVLVENKLTPKDIDLIAINNGPGSFTGIRAGAVTARTLGQFVNAPVVGLPSLEIYANAVNKHGEKVVILDARRSKWYFAHYDQNNIALTEPVLLHKDEILERLKTLNALVITEKVLQAELEAYNPVLFTEIETDFGEVITSLAKNKIAETENYQEVYAWYALKPVYLQTPSISVPKKKVLY